MGRAPIEPSVPAATPARLVLHLGLEDEMTRPLMARPLTTALLIGAGLASVSCASPRQADVQATAVDVGDSSLEVQQRFDADGALAETALTFSSPAGERELRVEGALLTGDGATAEGEAIRAFLREVDPEVLAALHEEGARFDVAVLTADTLLELDADAQAKAARALGGDGAPLCALLEACSDAHS